MSEPQRRERFGGRASRTPEQQDEAELLGSVLRELRTKAVIPFDKLAHFEGSHVNRLETGEQVPGALVLLRFLQDVGASAEQLGRAWDMARARRAADGAGARQQDDDRPRP